MADRKIQLKTSAPGEKKSSVPPQPTHHSTPPLLPAPPPSLAPLGSIQLRAAPSSEELKRVIYENVVCLNPEEKGIFSDARSGGAVKDNKDVFIKFANGTIYKCREYAGIPRGFAFLNKVQRETVGVVDDGPFTVTKWNRHSFRDSPVNSTSSIGAYEPVVQPSSIMICSVELFKPDEKKIYPVQEKTVLKTMESLMGQIFMKGQIFVLNHSNKALICTVKSIHLTHEGALKEHKEEKEGKGEEKSKLPPAGGAGHDVDDSDDGDEFKLGKEVKYGEYSTETRVIFEPSDGFNGTGRAMEWQSNTSSGIKLNKNFKFSDLKVGGMNKQFMQAFRRLIGTRFYSKDTIKRLGIKHVKGMLLHGPPGSGKTLLAREICKMLGLVNEPTIINGPELLSRWIGMAEEKTRAAFDPAIAEWREKGEDSNVHAIIFDEIDAVCRTRTSDSGAGAQVNANVLTTILTMLDGTMEDGKPSPGNILFIAMTNRKDVLDPALLRPGRLEVQLEIGLPDLKGRHEIFKIHTATMVKNGLLSPDVNLLELATKAKNYSGAEIEGLVKAATSLAVSEKIKIKDGVPVVMRDKKGLVLDPIVEMYHFLEAFNDVIPSFGRSEEISKQETLLNWSIEYEETVQELKEQVALLKSSTSTNLLTVLVNGQPCSGKSSLVRKICLESDFPFVKMISPESFSSLGIVSESGKVHKIISTFEDAYRSPLSIIVIDGIERLISYSSLGLRFSNDVLQIFLTYLNRDPPSSSSSSAGCKLLVLVTSANPTAIKNLELMDSFRLVIGCPMIEDVKHMEKIMDLLDFKMAGSEVVKLATILNLASAPLGIKNFLLMIDMVRQSMLSGRGGGGAGSGDIGDAGEIITAEKFLTCCKTMKIIGNLRFP